MTSNFPGPIESVIFKFTCTTHTEAGLFKRMSAKFVSYAVSDNPYRMREFSKNVSQIYVSNAVSDKTVILPIQNGGIFKECQSNLCF